MDSVWTGWRVWSVCWARGLPSNQTKLWERNGREIARALLCLASLALEQHHGRAIGLEKRRGGVNVLLAGYVWSLYCDTPHPLPSRRVVFILYSHAITCAYVLSILCLCPCRYSCIISTCSCFHHIMLLVSCYLSPASPASCFSLTPATWCKKRPRPTGSLLQQCRARAI